MGAQEVEPQRVVLGGYRAMVLGRRKLGHDVELAVPSGSIGAHPVQEFAPRDGHQPGPLLTGSLSRPQP